MFKIKHKETGLFLSHSGHRHVVWIHKYYSVTDFLSKYGKTWSTKNGPNRMFRLLESIYPGQFEIVEFAEVK